MHFIGFKRQKKSETRMTTQEIKWILTNIQSSFKYHKIYYFKINLPKNYHSNIHDDKTIELLMQKLKMFKIDARTFRSQLQRCYAFYVLPNCLRNHHTEFEINRTILLISPPPGGFFTVNSSSSFAQPPLCKITTFYLKLPESSCRFSCW